jgi:cytoskeletal protein CcmA (bactofilin family)
MALVLNDRVKETTTTTGQGTISLGGAATGFETFVTGVGDTNTTYYIIVHESDGTWEIGIGTIGDASPDTLARTTVIDTSAGNTTKIDFAAGSKTVFCTLPSSKAVFLDADGDVTLGANLDVGGNLTVTGTTTFNGGTLTLGDAATDNIAINATITSNLIFEGSTADAHETTLAPGNPSSDITLTLPSSASDTLVGKATTDTLTNKTLTTPVIAEIDSGSTITLDATTDITLDADGGDILFKDAGTHIGNINLDDSNHLKLKVITSDADFFIQGNDGGVGITAVRFDMSSAGAATFNDKITAVGTSVFTNLDISGDVDVDGTLEADAVTVNGTALSSVIAGTTVANATLAATVTVTDSTANTNFPVVFHDESNALLDDTGALRYNPSTGELLVPKLTVAGTTTTVDTVTMNASNAIIFEGATADSHETTLTIVDPTGDRTINLPNVSGTLPVLAAASTTQITSTPEELNILDGVTSTAAELNILDGVTSTAAELNILDGVTSTAAELNILDGVTSTAAELNVLDGITAVVGELNALDLGSTAVGTAIASKAVILDSNKDYTGIRNLTITGELDGATLDISGNADIDGTLEADAITIGGTSTDTLYASPGFAVAMSIAL